MKDKSLTQVTALLFWQQLEGKLEMLYFGIIL